MKPTHQHKLDHTSAISKNVSAGTTGCLQIMDLFANSVIKTAISSKSDNWCTSKAWDG